MLPLSTIIKGLSTFVEAQSKPSLVNVKVAITTAK